MRLLQVNVGSPTTIRRRGRTVTTGIFKEPVDGPVGVGYLNVEGDRQADLSVHGGWQKAVYAYTAEAYEEWRRARPDLDLRYGAFGENLTIEGLPEDAVCVGDRLRIGTVELMVTEPRMPCFKLGLRLGDDDVPAAFLERGRFGFYLAVTRPGHLRAGDEIVVVEQHPARFQVGRIGRIARDGDDVDGMRAAVELAHVPESWRLWFRNELKRIESRTGRRLLPPRPRPAWDGVRTLVVREKTPEARDVVSLHLDAADGSSLPPYRPGQHLTVELPAGGAPVVRSYSLSDRFRGDGYRLTVKREGIASSYIHDRLEPGDRLSAQAPGGSFVIDPLEHHRPVVLVGAGIGITPLLAMLNAIAEHEHPRETWLFYGVRHPRDVLMRERLEAIASDHPEIRMHLSHSRGAGDRPGRRLDIETLQRTLPGSYYDYYLCGPGGFMQALYDGLLDWGVPAHRIHHEAFGPSTITRHPRTPLGAPGSKITFVRSGATAVWTGEGRLLDLARESGVRIPFGCRAGSCGTCATRLVAGEVTYEHEPSAFVAADEILPCVAAPLGVLALDA
jgi:ferredoxin-NADP reductase/MOSC domain-containing protein YiiM